MDGEMSHKMVRILEGQAMRFDSRGNEEGIPHARVDVRGKTLRAYSAYSELRDTANWMHEELTAQLNYFDLSMWEFRVLDALRRGPKYLEEISQQLQCQKSNVGKVLQRLEGWGWVRRMRRRWAPARGTRSSRAGKRSRSSEPRDRRIIRRTLTPDGRWEIKRIHPKHVKLVKAYMRALDQREQLTLTRLCIKLRQGNIVRFAKEAKCWENDENWAEGVGRR
jgi:DNA-binding MarR family transcriptional regulator